MKTCPKCNNQVDDNTVFCTYCGSNVSTGPQPTGAYNNNNSNNQQAGYPNGGYYAAPPTPNYAPAYDPYDHTSEFDCKDISENKVIAMLPYLLGIFGIIIAMLGASSSPYAKFHVRQAIKFTVIDALMMIAGVVLFWTIIVPIAWGVMSIVFLVIKIICFVQICCGKAKEPVIIRSLPFLK